MHSLRDFTARCLRGLPHFRGKARVGSLLHRALGAAGAGDEHRTVRMWDGTQMIVDLRVEMETSSFWTGEYEYDVLRRLCSVLRRGDTVLDLGANIGFFSLAFGKQLQRLGGGRVYAFEPVPANFERLSEVVRLNRLEEVIAPRRLALGDREGEIELFTGYQGEELTGNAVVMEGAVREYVRANWNERPRKTESAAMVRLDTFAAECGLEQCHLIKADVEGSEYLFLQGAEGLIRRCRPLIYGEYNPIWMRQFGHSFEDVARLAREWEYDVYALVGPGRFRRQADRKAVFEDVLLVPAETSEEHLRKVGAMR